MHRHFWLIALSAVMASVGWASVSAQTEMKQPPVDTVQAKVPEKITFAFDVSSERRDGFTEYEIDIGWLPVQPDDELFPAGSRLRFPVNSILTRLGASAEYAGFSISAAAWLQLTNSEGLFRDYDWFEKGGKQNSFIFGSARNNDDSKQFDVGASYSFQLKNMRFTPRIRYSKVNMSFEAEDATQWQYYDIDSLLGLVPLEEVYVFDTAALVITYEIDYSAFYFGGSVAYEFPFGLGVELTGLYAPIASAEDLDMHLLRRPPKNSVIISDGKAGIAGLKMTYHPSRLIDVYGSVDYSFFNTDGKQKQTDLGEPYGIFVGIPATTKSEWYSIGGGLTLYLGR